MATATRNRHHLAYHRIDKSTVGRQSTLSAYFAVLGAQDDVSAMLDVEGTALAAATEMRERCLAILPADSEQFAAVEAISAELVASTVCGGRA